MQFIITIDTEGDNQWDHGRDLTVENIKFVPRFHALCEDYGIKPTYLVTSEICNDAYARDLFTGYISDGRAELGAHLHSWSTPPFIDSEGFRENDANHAFASELPYDLLNYKIANLTEQISASFGKRPTS
ncbi:MAG TPA: deacetylase, partial [Bacteroidales bacterium]|nr:deacetylase [Bacteroidales bacterium]